MATVDLPVNEATPAYSPRFDQALALTAELHRHQVRKGTGGVPYITHLMSVAALVGEHGGGEDEMIAALLHDAVEDQGGPATRDRVRELFGDAVIAIIDACTDTDEEPKPPWRERKEQHLAHLREASTPSDRLVIAADKLHNARCLLADLREHGHTVWDRFKAGREGTLWYLRSMTAELAAFGVTPLVAELQRTVAAIEDEANRTR